MYSWTSRLCAESTGFLSTHPPIDLHCEAGVIPSRRLSYFPEILTVGGAREGNTGSLLTTGGVEALRGSPRGPRSYSDREAV